MFVERFPVGQTPSDSQILELERVIIVEQDAPQTIVGIGQPVIAVGEVVNDHGQPNVPRILQSKGELSSYYGGFRSWLGSKANGWQGNLYAQLRPLNFPSLVICVPNMEANDGTPGMVVSKATLTSTNSGTSDIVIPAGTRLSDGATSIWATLEDVVVLAGAYLQTDDVRVRSVSGASTLAMGLLNTVVDVITGLTFTATNAAALTAAVADTAYLAAIDACLDVTSDANGCVAIAEARHTTATLSRLRSHADDASRGGVGRIAVQASVVGTTKANAKIAAALSREDRYCFAWPGWQYLLAEYSTTDLVTVSGDFALLALIANLGPEQDLSQATTFLNQFVTAEAVSGVSYGEAFYKEMKAAGIASPNIDQVGNRIIYSSVTTQIAVEGKKPIEQRRYSDYIQDSLAAAYVPYKGKPLTDEVKEGALLATQGFLQAELDKKKCAGFVVDISINTQRNLDLGIFCILVKVKRISGIKDIVLVSQIGTTVQVAEAA